jgi:hypothetical protein
VFNNPNTAVNSLHWAIAHWEDPTSLTEIATAIRQSFVKVRDLKFLLATGRVMSDLWRERADKDETVDFTPGEGWFGVNSSLKWVF